MACRVVGAASAKAARAKTKVTSDFFMLELLANIFFHPHTGAVLTDRGFFMDLLLLPERYQPF